MKMLTMFAALVMAHGFGSCSMALASTPFMPEVEARFKAAEVKKVVKVKYSVAANGGTIGARGLGVKLPPNIVITRSYFRVDTQFVDGGSGTVALSCEDANNIKTATDITGSSAGTYVEGASTGAASAFVASIAAPCEITATVAGADQTDGALTLWVEYAQY